MIHQVWSDIQDTYESLSGEKKSQVRYVMYDEFIRNPKSYLDPLASFLGTTTTRHTKYILKRKNLPANRPVDNERIKSTMAAKISPKETEMMEQLESEYQQLLQIHSLA